MLGLLGARRPALGPADDPPAPPRLLRSVFRNPGAEQYEGRAPLRARTVGRARGVSGRAGRSRKTFLGGALRRLLGPTTLVAKRHDHRTTPVQSTRIRDHARENKTVARRRRSSIE